MTDPAPGLPQRLREATADAHRRLERELDLLRPPLSQARFTAHLERFWGFHAAWEPAIRQHDDLAGLMAGRYRLDVLARDLRAAGVSAGEIEALPLCAPAADLGRSREGALGSLYVMEGSTLGGRVIGRALRDAPWLPDGGIGYFNPYGRRTAAMWRAVQRALQLESSPAADPLIKAAALRTFAHLHGCLVPEGTIS